jgi:hypothetical protein
MFCQLLNKWIQSKLHHAIQQNDTGLNEGLALALTISKRVNFLSLFCCVDLAKCRSTITMIKQIWGCIHNAYFFITYKWAK